MYKVLALIVLLLALIWFFAPKSQGAVADSEKKKKPSGTGGSCQCNGGEVASAGAVTGFAL